ncbi:MAG: uracil phosphoribosyltransferase [Bacteroidales bacterium]|nr:uracil phosphoribosyltransferase [Bacteroidales bacterium]
MKEIVLNNALVSHKMGVLRDKNTSTKEFREIIKELSTLLCYEAFRDVETFDCEIDTPVAKMTAKRINIDEYVFVPILRAGLGMMDGILQAVPTATFGFIGLYRNEETLEPVEYYFKMPADIAGRKVILLDPMLATGGSAVNAIGQLKKRGVKEIRFLCIVASPQGLEAVQTAHPDVRIYAASLDNGLNDRGYIVPGLGDAGDRIFHTLG